MNTESRGFSYPLLAAGLFGLSGVALGAMGAHLLKATLAQNAMLEAWETATRYHLWHAIALLGLGALGVVLPQRNRLIGWIAGCWTVGIVLFSGSLYALALNGPRWLGPVTPLGGLALMAGWLLVAVGAFSKTK
jgi:uncharacterized membrane protein YgdD (TMEM256/DUF423 family)